MIATFEDVAAAEDDRARVEGVIRRAERSLALRLLGPGADPAGLAVFDHQLVTDTVVDAVSRKLANPRGFVSETDGDYSYRLGEGSSDGFWWPDDLLDLFGIAPQAPLPAGTIPVRLSCGWRGMAG